MNEYINPTNQSTLAYLSLPNRNNAGIGEGLQAIGKGLIDFANQRKQNELFPLQKQTLQNQADMGAKQLSWFDRIQNANLNLKNAQASNIKATTGHTNAITAGQLLNNRFNKATLNNNIVAQNTKNQAVVAKNLLDTTAFSDIANSTYASDPNRQREYFDYVENYTNPRGNQLSDMDRMYYELLEQGKIPLDNDTGKPQSRAVWMLAQKNGAGKLNITQTNGLYKQAADISTATDQFLQEMVNYDPTQYGIVDTLLRKSTPITPAMQKAETHDLRLKSMIRDMIDKGNLTNQEQEQAKKLVSTWTESGTATSRKALLDLFIKGLESRIDNLENRGSFLSNDNSVAGLKKNLETYKKYRSYLDDWDGSEKIEFPDTRYKPTDYKKPISVKDYLNQNNPSPSTPQPRSNLVNQPNTQESKPKIDLSQFLKAE